LAIAAVILGALVYVLSTAKGPKGSFWCSNTDSNR